MKKKLGFILAIALMGSMVITSFAQNINEDYFKTFFEDYFDTQSWNGNNNSGNWWFVNQSTGQVIGVADYIQLKLTENKSLEYCVGAATDYWWTTAEEQSTNAFAKRKNFSPIGAISLKSYTTKTTLPGANFIWEFDAQAEQDDSNFDASIEHIIYQLGKYNGSDTFSVEYDRYNRNYQFRKAGVTLQVVSIDNIDGYNIFGKNHIKVIVLNGCISVYINDKLIIDRYSDSDALSINGEVGIKIQSGYAYKAHLYIDNVSIKTPFSDDDMAIYRAEHEYTYTSINDEFEDKNNIYEDWEGYIEDATNYTDVSISNVGSTKALDIYNGKKGVIAAYARKSNVASLVDNGTDYIETFDIQHTYNGGKTEYTRYILGSYNDGTNYYRLYVQYYNNAGDNANGCQFKLIKTETTGGQTTTYATVADSELSYKRDNAWNSVKIIRSNNTVIMYMNNVFAFSATDESFSNFNGRVGFETYTKWGKDTHTYIDNLLIKTPDANEILLNTGSSIVNNGENKRAVVKLDVPVKQTDVGGVLVVAAYDNTSHEMKACNMLEINFQPGKQSRYVLDFDTLISSNEYIFKAFLWDSLDNASPYTRAMGMKEISAK